MRKAERKYQELATAISEAKDIPPCQQTDPELWFSDRDDIGITYRIAKKFCQQCPVQKECLEYALAANETFGIWGGLTPQERFKLMGRGKGSGRPRGRQKADVDLFS